MGGLYILDMRKKTVVYVWDLIFIIDKTNFGVIDMKKSFYDLNRSIFSTKNINIIVFYTVLVKGMSMFHVLKRNTRQFGI